MRRMTFCGGSPKSPLRGTREVQELQCLGGKCGRRGKQRAVSPCERFIFPPP